MARPTCFLTTRTFGRRNLRVFCILKYQVSSFLGQDYFLFGFLELSLRLRGKSLTTFSEQLT